MQQILNSNLFIGSKYDLNLPIFDEKNWAFVHACKTLHFQRLGKLPKNSPFYLMFEEKNHLYINWVDAPVPAMFDWQKQRITNFTIALDFIEKWLKTKKVFVHCDQGQSRSPALGMLLVAKRMKKISPNFELAKLEFAKIYPEYFSESGITKFINQNWNSLK